MDLLTHDDALDMDLVTRGQAGDRAALDQLIRRHQPWLLHIAQRMLWNRADAEDAAQEILIKAITHLAGFERRSVFRTWLYRIAANHLLDRARTKSFEQVAQGLDEMPDQALPESKSTGIESAILLEEVKIACTTAILLCLKPRQRLTFILGEILGLSDEVGAAVMDTTAGNFRQILSRTRRELYGFLNQQCGLVNRSNRCRCANKAGSFIANGWVRPRQLQFVGERLAEVRRVAPERTRELQQLEQQHALIFREEPLQAPRDQAEAVRKLLQASGIGGSMELDL
jgi:RNA polymerase sigma factor (sigma-70 family)